MVIRSSDDGVRRSLRRWTTGLVLCSALLTAARGGEVIFALDLALAPDGRTLAFAWAGDVWTVPAEGGAARRLTVHPAEDGHPVWSRDGARIAFASRRHGAFNVFTMTGNGSQIQRLTYGDRSTYPTDWTPDDAAIVFHARREGQVFWEARPYLVSATGGQPRRLFGAYGQDARLSPSGELVVFNKGRVRSWRRRYRGSANAELWLYRRTTDEYQQLTDFNGTDRAARWAGDDAGVYFLSDRGGTVNVWYQPLGGAARQITQMDTDDVRDFAVAADGSFLIFTHWDRIYRQALPNGEPEVLSVVGSADAPLNPREPRTLTDAADEVAVAPDGKSVAVVVRGEIFVTETAEDRPTRRVTDSPYRDQHVVWSPDGRALFFTSDRTGREQIYRATSAEDPPAPLAESLRFRIEQVTAADVPCYAPQLAPDGEHLAYLRLRGDVVIRTLVGGAETVLLESWNRPTLAWSPDGTYLALSVEDQEHNADIWIVPADGSAEPVNISQHPDYDMAPAWSADGQVLTFASRRSGFDTDLYLVFLSAALDEADSVAIDDYFEAREKAVKQRKPPTKTPASGAIMLADGSLAVSAHPAEADETDEDDRADTDEGDSVHDAEGGAEAAADDDEAAAADEAADAESVDEEQAYAYELDTAYRRLRRVTRLPGEQTRHALHPVGNLLAFVSEHEGKEKLFSITWDGEDRKPLRSDAARALQWTLSGKRLFYRDGGAVRSCTSSGGDAKKHAYRALLIIDYIAEARQKFDDAARELRYRFYHPEMKGLDWAALTAKYRALAERVPTTSEFNAVFRLLLGELNASHLGIYGGRETTTREPIGYLGVTLDPAYTGPGLRISATLPRGPATRRESTLRPGAVLLRVNDQSVGPAAPLERALIATVDQPVVVEYLPAGDPAETEPEQLVIRPVSYGTLAELAYDAWVADNRAHVEQQSAGRVGYVHIRAMNESSFEVFERDLYAAANDKEALIIDVRNNGGGWTTDWVMAVLSVQRHAFTVPRGGEPGYPQGRLIFYAWTRPATLMCNQYSFSNAEIVSHAFKTLERGPLVGMTTYGAVISTGSYDLIDGSRIRMPFRGWYTLPGGTDMENNGAEPDIRVPVSPADEAAGRRPQLDAAIAASLAQLRPE